VLAAGCIGSGNVAAAPRERVDVAGKPVAPFGVRSDVVGTPSVGQPVEVRITVRPSLPMTELELEAAGDASLDVAAADARQSAPSATRESPAEWSVSVVPRDAGTLRLKVTVDGVIDGERQARSIVVPIRVAGQAAQGDASGGGKTEAKSAATPAESGDEGGDEGQGDGLIHLHSSE
jgi:hypothetical protein